LTRSINHVVEIPSIYTKRSLLSLDKILALTITRIKRVYQNLPRPATIQKLVPRPRPAICLKLGMACY